MTGGGGNNSSSLQPSLKFRLIGEKLRRAANRGAGMTDGYFELLLVK